MGVVNPKGSEKYWFDGLPFDGFKTLVTELVNGEKFWFQGLPLEHLFSSTGARRYNLFELQLDWGKI